MGKRDTKYVDGFVLVVPKKNLRQYRKIARDVARFWKKHGAIAYRECMLDEARPKGARLFFTTLAKPKRSETVWFSYIEYRSKQHRNQVNKRVMKALAGKFDIENMPFDMKRMAWGGFRVEVGT
ncbi:MAG: DUF1428 domain-containing protein [Ignavibacteria bacterium]|nr:DUF1428 domain-containing protein [Ignavibacteria bacterium]